MERYPERSAKNDEYTVRNYGRKVGKTKSYKKNLKRMLLVGMSYVVFTTTGFVIGRVTSKDTEPENNYSFNVVSEDSFDVEPTYNGIEYTVKLGENLTGIIASYETDADKMYRYLDRIVDLSGLDNASTLRDGTVIRLVGVPESKLELFGYSADYNLFDPNIELDDRVDFLKETSSDVVLTDENETQVGIYMYRLTDLQSAYKDYSYNKNDEDLDELLNEARELCYELKEIMGFDFEFNKTAYPLSRAINYSNEESMSY